MNAPAFLEQLRLEGEMLKYSPGDKDAADFIEAVMAETMKDHPY